MEYYLFGRALVDAHLKASISIPDEDDIKIRLTIYRKE